MTDSEQPPDELIAVQETLMHQQRDLQQMHEVLLAQQNEIEELRKEVAQLRGDVQTQLGEDRLPNPDEEKPPHY
jgi:uncharacterized coiled-coil protein SlyX